MRGQGAARDSRVLLDEVGEIGLVYPGQGVQRQAQPHGRIARHQVHALIAEEPRSGGPFRTRQARARARLYRHDIAHDRVQFLLKDATQTGTFHLVVQTRIEGIHIHRQTAFAPQVVPAVLVAGLNVFIDQSELGGQRTDEIPRLFGRVLCGRALVGKQRRVGPHHLAIGAPVNVQGPARQLLARIPLALAKVQKAATPVFVPQFVHEFGGKAALGGAEGIGIPFGGVAVVYGHKGGLATHRQAHVARQQFGVYGFAQLHDLGPLRFGVGLGDAGGFVNARDRHVVRKLDLAFVYATFNGRGARGLHGASQRDVAFAGKQP